MPLILGTNSIKDTGYNVANSCRFNSGSSDYLNRTPDSAGNLRTMTFSFWMKRSKLTSDAQRIFSIFNNSGADQFWLRTADSSNDYIDFFSQTSSTQTLRLVSSARLRDVSAWYHIVIAVDTTQGTDSNRIKMYINGVQQTSFSTTSYPSQNTDLEWNKAIPNMIGAQQSNGTAEFIDMYLSEVCFIDGQQLAPTSFGEFDSDNNIWKPIDVSGLTFGTNGFYLQFKGSGTSANSSGLGADTSGNTHHFTVNNLTALDQSTDTCTNNFATMNPLDNFYAATTFSEGNLKAVTSSGNESYNTATIGVASGKWYWEVKIVNSSTNGTYGITDSVTRATNNYLGDDAYDTAYLKDGKVYRDSGYVSGFSNANTLTAYDTGAILMFALDLTNNALYAGHNGTWGNSSDPTSGASKTGAIPIDAVTSTGTGFYFPAFGEWTGSAAATYSVNFGSPEFAISSGNADGNGFGNFEYAVPSGYFSLCTKNLAEHG